MKLKIKIVLLTKILILMNGEDGVDIFVTYEVLENIGTNEKIVF